MKNTVPTQSKGNVHIHSHSHSHRYISYIQYWSKTNGYKTWHDNNNIYSIR